MKKFVIGLLLILWEINAVEAQEFTATVNRNPVPEGETVVLTLELKNVDTTANPDLNKLTSDFTVMSVSNGYRTNIINGNVSKSKQWNLVMIPNHSGEIIIPEIELAGYKTETINLKVKPAGSEPVAEMAAKQQIDNAPRFKMSATVDNNSPYVQQQITYKLKILDSGGLQGDAPVFVTDNDDWIIKSLGQPEVATKIINGQSLREITFNYALFAQKSGSLMIPPVKFNGYYLTKNSRIDPFASFFGDNEMFAEFGLNDIFARKNPVVLTAKPISVEVKPAEVADGWWLPASKVDISAEFDDATPQFNIGEPISRTIYLRAYGVMDTQLPELNFASVEGLKQYPEKPVTEMMVDKGQIVSIAQINNVYIPTKSGDIELPEIKVKWFNTQTKTLENAVLPSYTAKVKGVAAYQKPEADSQQPTLTKSEEQPQIQEINNIDNQLIVVMLLGSFIGGMILALLLFKLFGLSKTKKSNHYHYVIKAAQNADVHNLRDELIEWGKEKYPLAGITNLQDLADLINDEDFNLQIDKIREFLYAGNDKLWDGQTFIKTFKKAAASKIKCQDAEENILPKLYK